MEAVLEALKSHGYSLLFVAVLLDQFGVPLPSIPMLLGAGAFVGMGFMNGFVVLGLVMAASLIADLVWYELGRRKGKAILGVLCRVSLEPETCIRSTEGVFERYGVRCLLFAKFVPGLYTVTPPLAGMTGLSISRFALWDSGGILAYAGVYLGLGYALRNQLDWLLDKVESYGASVFQLMVLVLVVHLAVKWVRRRQFIGRLRTARISPEELKVMMDQGVEMIVADLRRASDLRHDPWVIPGALVIAIDELQDRHGELPRDRDIVLYCT